MVKPRDLSTTDMRPSDIVRPDCSKGLHVARLGSACVCGDPGPAMAPPTPIVLGEVVRLKYTAPH